MTDAVQIVAYAPHHAPAWKALNEAWITRHFFLEPSDRRVLDDPQGQVLAQGGHILMAQTPDGRAVGCCALLPLKDDPTGYELAKMAVDETLRGQGIGKRLMAAAVEAAVGLGASRLYIETNASLTTAIGLYEAFGFVHLPARPTPYARCDVWMERML